MTQTLNYSNMNNAEAFVDLKSEAVDFNLAGDNVLISGVALKKIYVYRIFLVVGSDMDLTFKDGLSDELSGSVPMLANGSLTLDMTNVPWFQTSDGNDFILESSDSGQVGGVVYYQQF